jgi:anti-sigma-K factor RskA/putative zinc finger protein
VTSSSNCNECRSLLGGYVLHALEPNEAESVRLHLAACDACAIEHGELIGLPELLDVAGSTETASEQPPPALEEAVLDRFARENRAAAGASAAPTSERGTPRDKPAHRRARDSIRRRLARPLPAALTGAAAAAAVTAALILLPGTEGSAQADHYRASLRGGPSIPNATATADLRVFPSGTHVNLRVRGLRGQPDSVYELWCIRDDGVKISAGTFHTDSSGRADVTLTTAAVPGEYHRLSVERKAFSPPSDSGERVMAGEIQYPRW